MGFPTKNAHFADPPWNDHSKFGTWKFAETKKKK